MNWRRIKTLKRSAQELASLPPDAELIVMRFAHKYGPTRDLAMRLFRAWKSLSPTAQVEAVWKMRLDLADKLGEDLLRRPAAPIKRDPNDGGGGAA